MVAMTSLRFSVSLVVAIVIANVVSAKRYERCELVRELRDKHAVPEDHLATYTCIAHRESGYRTDVQGKTNKNGSRDHGIFQINDRWWCSPPGVGKECNVTCAELKTDDITKAVVCAKKIWTQTTKSKGNGFKAWSTFKYCNTTAKVAPYVEGC